MTPRNWPAQQLLLRNRAVSSQTPRLGVTGASDVAIAVNHRVLGTINLPPPFGRQRLYILY